MRAWRPSCSSASASHRAARLTLYNRRTLPAHRSDQTYRRREIEMADPTVDTTEPQRHEIKYVAESDADVPDHYWTIIETERGDIFTNAKSRQQLDQNGVECAVSLGYARDSVVVLFM
ncbi:hypothetical protein [Pandoravirus japonicus]|uniref:Uncharacterized protein n=1 Tax=Pandoravirus japonicus TaxID=2823154 RepID=A0A811BRY9_9VIRU|nr:hypothetical protein [Pandoravirus japonicus]